MNPLQDSFIRTVQEEVKPALGCTEPISLTLVATIASSELNGAVERISAWVLPNLMKDGMDVTVSDTGVVGLPAAAVLDALGGNAHAGLEVLKDASSQAIVDTKAVLNVGKVAVVLQKSCENILSSRAEVYSTEGQVCVTTMGGHTNVVYIEINRSVVFTTEQNAQEEEQESPLAVLSHTSLEEILAFVNVVPFESIRFILDMTKLNGALSQEGLRDSWGLYIGTTFEKQCVYGLLVDGLSTSILIRTGAALDTRVGGTTLPVTSNSGLDNQGITATVPMMVMAEHSGANKEKLARTLTLSHPNAIYVHHQLPRLSVLCAATTAAMEVAAGVAWIVDGRYNTTAMAVSSMIDDVNGVICDGVSNSYAMEVSTSAPAAWKTVLMTLDGATVTGNEGIVTHSVERSTANPHVLACCLMQGANKQVIETAISKAH